MSAIILKVESNQCTQAHVVCSGGYAYRQLTPDQNSVKNCGSNKKTVASLSSSEAHNTASAKEMCKIVHGNNYDLCRTYEGQRSNNQGAITYYAECIPQTENSACPIWRYQRDIMQSYVAKGYGIFHSWVINLNKLLQKKGCSLL